METDFKIYQYEIIMSLNIDTKFNFQHDASILFLLVNKLNN